jgi:hypothetical protein
MWQNRWVRVVAVALGIFVINGISRLASRLAEPDTDPLVAPVEENSGVVIAVLGALSVVVFLAVIAAVWAVRNPQGRVIADLGAATLVGVLLALLIGPFIGGGTPFAEGLETFVLEFLQFVGLCALGAFIGFVAMVALGRDWKSRGLAAYARKYGKRPQRSGR